MKTKIYALFLFFCIALFLPVVNVSAASKSDPFYLNETKLKLQVGNTYNLYLLNSNNTDESFYYFYYYPCTWKTSDESVALVEDGYVTIVGKGKATITATYNGKKYTCKITATASSYRLTKNDITTKTYSEETIRMTHTDHTDYYSYNVYLIEDGQEILCYDAFDISIDSYTGQISLKALQGGNYRIDFIAHTQDENYQFQTYKASCNVNVAIHGLIESDVGCALGTKRQLTFGDLTQITFQVDNPSIAIVDENGLISPLEVGITFVTMNGYNDQHVLEQYQCNLYITNPSVSMNKPYVILGDYVSLDITDNSWQEAVIYKSSNEEIIKANDYSLSAVKEGKATVAVIVDGKKFTFKVEVVNPRLETEAFLLKKSETTNVTLLGLNNSLKEEPVTYSVDNRKIATVSEDGIITAKSYGNTLLTVKLADFTFTASINVGKNKAIEAIKNATAALGSIYSQEKRMQKGYYDCSSLIWRSYAPTGITFGSSSYAPTAANIAKYLDENKKVVSYEYIDPKKLQPGDLIFYAGGNNGRYKNIYHVSIFIGIAPYESYGYYSDDLYIGQIIHASQGSVIQSNLSESYGDIVMIARPTK